jgi:hypothetical protein
MGLCDLFKIIYMGQVHISNICLLALVLLPYERKKSGGFAWPWIVVGECANLLHTKLG